MKYTFKYHSNTSFNVYPATNSAGVDISEVITAYREFLENELFELDYMTNEEFLKYFGVSSDAEPLDFIKQDDG